MKQLKRKPLSGALVQALGAGVALSVIATGAAAQQTQKVEKIEVTGSNIKRVDMETVAPVEIITRDQIERSGMPTVADVIRNIPADASAAASTRASATASLPALPASRCAAWARRRRSS